MKKIAKFNPNVRNVGDVLTASIGWALTDDVDSLMTHVVRSLAEDNVSALTEGHQMATSTSRLISMVMEVVRHLTPQGVVNLHQSQTLTPLEEHARVQTSFRAMTIDGEPVLRLIKADRRLNPRLARRNKYVYLVCYYDLYPHRPRDNVRWEIETFNDVTIERLESYIPERQGAQYYPPLDRLMKACMAHLGLEFSLATDHHRSPLKTLALQPNRLIAALGTMSTQAILDAMRAKWVEKVSIRNENHRYVNEKRLLDVPTYPFEFHVDPTQRVGSLNPNRDDCEVWELFVYNVGTDARVTSRIARYSNEAQILRDSGTSAVDRQARRHARLAKKYQELAEILRDRGLTPPAPEIDLLSDSLGAKIVAPTSTDT